MRFPLCLATLLFISLCPLALASLRSYKRLVSGLLDGETSTHGLSHQLAHHLSPFSQVFEGYEHSDCDSRRTKQRDELVELMKPALNLVRKLNDGGILCNLPLARLLPLFQGGEDGRGALDWILSPLFKRRSQSPSRKTAPTLDAQINFVHAHVHWHVVHNRTTGKVAKETIAAQMLVLNTLFNHVLALNLTVKSIQYIGNDALFRSTHSSHLPASQEMRKRFRRGDKAAINIWTVELPSRANGYSTFPEDLDSGLALDGIVIDHRTLPGCSKDDEDRLGISLIHEVGHMLGLDHTFSPCDSLGDGVDDTPMQLHPTGYDVGCPVDSIDTCPGRGMDDVSNFMNYAPEECRNHFTLGQLARMRAASTKYRGLPLMDDPTAPIALSYAQDEEKKKQGEAY